MYKFHTEIVCIRLVDNFIDVDNIINKKNDKLVVYYNARFIGNELKV